MGVEVEKEVKSSVEQHNGVSSPQNLWGSYALPKERGKSEANRRWKTHGACSHSPTAAVLLPPGVARYPLPKAVANVPSARHSFFIARPNTTGAKIVGRAVQASLKITNCRRRMRCVLTQIRIRVAENGLPVNRNSISRREYALGHGVSKELVVVLENFVTLKVVTQMTFRLEQPVRGIPLTAVNLLHHCRLWILYQLTLLTPEEKSLLTGMDHSKK